MDNKRRNLILCFLIILIPLELNGFYNPYLAKSPNVYWFCDIFSWIFLPTIVFAIMIHGHLVNFKELGLQESKPTFQYYLTSLFFIIVMTFLLYNGYVAAKAIAYQAWPHNYWEVSFSYVGIAAQSPGLKKLMILYFAFTAGVVEEIYFRGILRTFFSESILGKISFVLVSSLLFSSVHWEQGVRGLFATFVFGILAATYYVCRKDLWPLIGGHAMTWLILEL